MPQAEVKGPRPYHVAGVGPVKFLDYARPARASERFKRLGRVLNWRPTDWTEPRYPGDSILRVDLVRGDEFGDVRVQWYGNGLTQKDGDKLKVGSFTPGYETSSPGDTPKWWPDRDEWVESKSAASKIFMQFVIAAIRQGWRVKE